MIAEVKEKKNVEIGGYSPRARLVVADGGNGSSDSSSSSSDSSVSPPSTGGKVGEVVHGIQNGGINSQYSPRPS